MVATSPNTCHHHQIKENHMDVYIVTHRHNHGVSVYTVKAAFSPDEEEAVEALNIDFEPNKGETIDVDIFDDPKAMPILYKLEDGSVTTSVPEPDTFQEYIKEGGECCPFCQDSDIDGGPVDIDTNCAIQKMSCANCERDWKDVYTLTSAEEV